MLGSTLREMDARGITPRELYDLTLARIASETIKAEAGI